MSPTDPDVESLVDRFRRDLNAGTLSLVLLDLLHRAAEERYGYEIVRELENRARGAIPVKQGTIYPLLRSLERKGLLRSRTGRSTQGPPRRYYRITPKGERVLDQWRSVWHHAARFVTSSTRSEEAG